MLPKPISLAVALATNALTIVLAGSVHNHCKQPDIEKMVVFGDSYSDTGNVWQLTKHTWPLDFYYRGRFTNGPVWSEYVRLFFVCLFVALDMKLMCECLCSWPGFH